MTNEAGFADVLDPALVAALEDRGYTNLTQVQRAVVDSTASGRDLRISSQTGSGKTVAVGIVLHPLVIAPREEGQKGPRALVIAPTRELARQFEDELRWLYSKSNGVRVASITGGASYRDEHRALASVPDVVVGTPGRLIDHMERGTLDLSGVRAVVLDEADRMLDLGFRESLETILDKTPADRCTHLVSATFADDVRRLADRVQRNAIHVEGTRLGAANADIEHVIIPVDPRQRFDAIVNMLLSHPDASTIVFARTRADVADITDGLAEAGFAVAPLSGEMEQRERTRALSAFKRGAVRVLVATDVAARGIDVQDITLVLHVEPPTDADSYTHRSGRTGRAGRKGVSALLVAPRELPGVRRVLARARVQVRMGQVPDAATIRRQLDDRLIAELTDESTIEPDARTLELASRLVAQGDAERTIARLLAKSPVAQGPAPREVRPIVLEQRPERPRAAGPNGRGGFDGPRGGFDGPRGGFDGPRGGFDGPRGGFDGPRGGFDGPRPRFEGPRPGFDGPRPGFDGPREGGFDGPPRPSRDDREWALFHVTWGARHGADPRRVLAMLCRRGEIQSSDIGGIRVGPLSSEVQIAAEVAPMFAEAAGRKDPRDPRVLIHPDRDQAAAARPRAWNARPDREGPGRGFGGGDRGRAGRFAGPGR